MLPIFLQELFEADRFLVWGKKRQNAAEFSPRAFSGKSISSFAALKLETGQSAADFSPRAFRQIDFWFGGFKSRAKCS